MQIIKLLFIGLFLSLSPLQNTHAQSESDRAMEAVQDIAQWANAYNEALSYYIVLFNDESLEQISTAFDTDDEELLISSAKQYSEHRAETLRLMKNAIAKVPSIPNLNIFDSQGEKLEDALKTSASQLSVIYAEAEEASKHLEAIFTNASRDDNSGLSELSRLQDLALIRAIEAENIQVDAAILAIPRNNPNYALQHMIKAQNIIAIQEIKLAALSFDEPILLKDRLPYTNEMKKQLNVVRRHLKTADAKTKTLSSSIGTMISRTKNQKEQAFLRKAKTAIDTFDEQFEIERELLAWVEKSYALYSAEGSSDDYEEDIEANDTAIIDLSLERIEIIKKRTKLMTN